MIECLFSIVGIGSLLRYQRPSHLDLQYAHVLYPLIYAFYQSEAPLDIPLVSLYVLDVLHQRHISFTVNQFGQLFLVKELRELI